MPATKSDRALVTNLVTQYCDRSRGLAAGGLAIGGEEQEGRDNG
jgi:hypothetical protein